MSSKSTPAIPDSGGMQRSPSSNRAFRFLSTAAVAAVALAAGLQGAAQGATSPPGYTVKGLGTLGGTSTEASGVNDHSVVVGTSTTAAGETHAFRWDARGGMVDLGAYASVAPPPGINNMGHVFLNVPLPGGLVRVERWDPRTGLQDLSTLGGLSAVASDINDRGEIAGWSETTAGTTHAFLWSPKQGMTDLGTLRGGYSGPANEPCGYCAEVNARGTVSLNDRGQVAGQSDGHAFRWDSRSGMVDLGVLGVDPWGQDFSFASDINERGVVIGSSSSAEGGPFEDYGPHAFLAAPGSAMINLGTIGWFSHATAVNDRGQVVGNSTQTLEYGYAGFAWDRQNGLSVVASGLGGYTTDINSEGTVVGAFTSGAVPQTHCVFVWDRAAGMRCLPSPSGGGEIWFADINDGGVIVGGSALWEPIRQLERG